jgi:hypothetical protein
MFQKPSDHKQTETATPVQTAESFGSKASLSGGDAGSAPSEKTASDIGSEAPSGHAEGIPSSPSGPGSML